MSRITGLLIADGTDFVSRAVQRLDLTVSGIVGDRHAGTSRKADARTPWHRRGTAIANTRQLSLVSEEDCAEIAALVGVATLDPALLGANIVVGGLSGLSLLTPGTRLQAPSGATIFVTEQNAPCRQPAKKLAAAHGRPELAATFARAAIGRRGLVGIVEREGSIAVGESLRLLPSPARVNAPELALDAPGAS